MNSVINQKFFYIERGEVIDDEEAMLAELDKELGIERPNPAKRAEELRAKIKEELNLCLQFK